MEANNYDKISQVQEHYVTRHVDMVKSLGAIPISWQDPLDFGVNVHCRLKFYFSKFNLRFHF